MPATLHSQDWDTGPHWSNLTSAPCRSKKNITKHGGRVGSYKSTDLMFLHMCLPDQTGTHEVIYVQRCVSSQTIKYTLLIGLDKPVSYNRI